MGKIYPMHELDELERTLMHEIEAKQRELKTVRDAKALLAKSAKSGSRPSDTQRTKSKAKSETSGPSQNGALASNEDMRRAITDFRGEFASAEVTAELRKHFPKDKLLPKKVARVLYDLRKEGKLDAELMQQAGSKRYTYKNK